jgi:hypothetical protein
MVPSWPGSRVPFRGYQTLRLDLAKSYRNVSKISTDGDRWSPVTVLDLELLIEEQPGSDGRCFDLRLKARDPELDLNYRPVGSIQLRAEPGAFFRQHLAEIWKTRPTTNREWATFTDQLRAKGAYLSETILPSELRNRLSDLRGKARTLLVQSDDPWIPWELLRIPEEPGTDAADGPFLCEAFALTRWIRGIRQTLCLPLRNIAVVIPRDSGLPQAAGECGDMLALARGEARRVERIPARVADLLEAFNKGDYDGWHFTGHGFHRESTPDLSGIWLEDEEELTPVHLSGKAKRMGVSHPLVFLNACSTGKSGMSLTEMGGWVPHFLKAGAGVCLGALWPIDDGPARAFAREFYSAFTAGAPVAEAVLAARQAIRSDGNPTWLAYTVFAHPLAVCAPPLQGEFQAGLDTTGFLTPVAPVSPPVPVAKPPGLRKAWTASTGVALALLLVSMTGSLIERAHRNGAPGKAAPPAAEITGGRPVPQEASLTGAAQAADRKRKAPADPPAAVPETNRPTVPAPKPTSVATAAGIRFEVAAAPGVPKSTLTGALRRAAAPLDDLGTSGWTLYLEVEAPDVTTQNQDGLPMELCRLSAQGHARRQGNSLDLGPVHGANSQFDRKVACEEAAKALAEEAVHQLVSFLRKGAT